VATMQAFRSKPKTQEWKGVLVGVHWHSEGRLDVKPRRSLLQ
jgi:hypothetical protein